MRRRARRRRWRGVLAGCGVALLCLATVVWARTPRPSAKAPPDATRPANAQRTLSDHDAGEHEEADAESADR